MLDWVDFVGKRALMDDTTRNEPRASGVIYRFGLFALDLSSLSLTRNGIRVKLQEQPFQLLAYLLEKNGQIVTRDDLRQRLWPGNTFVDFDKSLGVAVLKVREALGDSATNPTFLETVPRRGYRFIAPVAIETVPQQPATARAELKTEVSPAGPSDAPPIATAVPRHEARDQARHVRKRKLWTRAAIVCATIGLGISAFFLLPGLKRIGYSPARSVTSSQKARRSVAVLGFKNVAGDPSLDWLSTAFTEMLNTELSANGDLRLVSSEDVANVKRDLSLSGQDSLAKQTLAQLRSNLGADVIVAGSYTLLKDGSRNRIRLDLRAQDTALGETVAEHAITGNESDLFDIAAQAGNRLRESLNPALSLAPGKEDAGFPGSANQLALQFYAEGLARIHAFDFVGARDFLKRAVTADPSFAMAHSALSDAWSRLGYGSEERKEAQLAVQSAHGLAPEAVLVVKGRYQESVSDWTGAASTYQTLFSLFPDNLNYGLRLATAQLHLNPPTAKRTLDALRTIPAPVGDDPRIDLLEASVLISRDIPGSRAAAERAIAKASALGATLMVARAYGVLCQQNNLYGQPLKQSVAECTLARDSYMSAGDLDNAARTSNDLAGLYYEHGDLDTANKMWLDAIAVFRQSGDKEGLAASSNNLGDVLLTRGRLNEAGKFLKEAIEGYRDVGDQSGVALAKVDLGQIALKKADLGEADADYQQAIAAADQATDKSAAAYGLMGLGDVALARNRMTDARGRYEAALKLRKEINEAQTILESQIALARLTLEEGRAAEAERDARTCEEQAHKADVPDDELEAGLLLTRALLAQTHPAAARTEMTRLRPLDEKTQNRELNLRFSLRLAQILFAEGDYRSAKKLAEVVRESAKSAEFNVLSWEAQAVSLDAQKASGDAAGTAQPRKHLQAQERAAGLLLLAGKTDPSASFE